jgi:hypothetical protein
MMSPKVWRGVARLHFWISTVFGLQVLIWIGTGLYFAATPIAEVRGEHLRHKAAPALAWAGPLAAPELAAAAAGGEPSTITLRPRGAGLIYLVETTQGARVAVDARSGLLAPAMTPQDAASAAAKAYAGRGAMEGVAFHQEPPAEYSRPGPVYAVQFGPTDAATLYVDAVSGEARVVRTDTWRLYDVLWGLHIMDWANRENFNTVHLIGFAIGALALSLSGMGLAVARLLRRTRRA